MTRPWRLMLVAISVTVLGGCAAGPDSSYVGPIDTPADARVLASGLAEFLAAWLPAAAMLALDPTPSGQDGNALTPALIATLRARGFAIADDRKADKPGTHRVRYWVTPLDNGDLVRLTVDGTEASRLFARNSDGTLQPAGPYTVRLDADAAS